MDFVTRTLLRIGLAINFHRLTPFLKILASYIRYNIAIEKNKNFSESRDIILICGLPKSGTTWLENLLSVKGDFKNLMPVDITRWEQKYGRSDDYEPHKDIFARIPKGKWLIKVHSKYSDNLMNLIRRHNLKLIVLYRDIDEVLDSHLHYVSKTKFHPDYNHIKRLSKIDGFHFLRHKYAEDYAMWIKDWLSKDVFTIDYNDLLSNTESILANTYEFLEIEVDSKGIDEIIKYNSLDNMKKRSVQKDFFRGKNVIPK
jgi:hypothetical protein